MRRSHTRDSSTQPANFTKVKQIAILHADLINQCLELAMIQAAGEDGVDDLHHNRHDVNEVGRLGAKSLLVNDVVHLVYCVWAVAELGGEPDARPSWAGGCPPML